MNLFKIDFIMSDTTDPDYNVILHSLTDTVEDRKIISLSVSADKLQSDSNYTREPKRLVFECILDTWMETYIISDDYEYEKYISKFFVKVYRDGVIIFTGMIDTSQISRDRSSDLVKITCYDFTKLLTLFELEFQMLIATGYHPMWLLGLVQSQIESTIPVSLPAFQYGLLNNPELSANQMLIASCDYSEMEVKPHSTMLYVGPDPTSWSSPKYGYLFKDGGNRLYFIFAHIKIFSGVRTRFRGMEGEV